MMLMLSMGAGCLVEKREIAGQAGNDENARNDERPDNDLAYHPQIVTQ